MDLRAAAFYFPLPLVEPEGASAALSSSDPTIDLDLNGALVDFPKDGFSFNTDGFFLLERRVSRAPAFLLTGFLPLGVVFLVVEAALVAAAARFRSRTPSP